MEANRPWLPIDHTHRPPPLQLSAASNPISRMTIQMLFAILPYLAYWKENLNMAKHSIQTLVIWLLLIFFCMFTRRPFHPNGKGKEKRKNQFANATMNGEDCEHPLEIESDGECSDDEDDIIF